MRLPAGPQTLTIEMPESPESAPSRSGDLPEYDLVVAGDAVPDFKLRNQDGRAIHLGQFHGKALVVTFIYTRCPSPDTRCQRPCSCDG